MGVFLMNHLRLILFFGLCQFANSPILKEPVDEGPDLNAYRQIVQRLVPNIPEHEKEIGARLLQSHEMNRSRTLRQRESAFNQLKQIPPFDCPYVPPSDEIPTSVHKLKPGDFKIVAALGDSLTAGFGAKAESIFHIFNEYRGVSWSIGGDCDIDSVKTLPNALRFYNPDLYGFSIGIADFSDPDAKFNRAINGSRAPALISQAFDLVTKMKSDPNIDVDEDWKMITIWIGSNDLCDICDDEETYSPDNYEENIRKVLDFIQIEIPRVFVNLIQGIDVTVLHEVESTWCRWLHAYECSCGSSDDDKVRQKVRDTLKEYNKRLGIIADDPKYNTDDFTVVVQPFLKETDLPKNEDGTVDMDYFAPDCFHFSFLSHEAAAVGLWNNLWEPVHHKKEIWTPGEPFECPSANNSYYIYTNKKIPDFDVFGDRNTRAHSIVYRRFLALWMILSMVGGAFLLLLILIVTLKLWRTSSAAGYTPL